MYVVRFHGTGPCRNFRYLVRVSDDSFYLETTNGHRDCQKFSTKAEAHAAAFKAQTFYENAGVPVPVISFISI